ncbi:thioesterase [Micromonospora sp. STR1_7]|uniref:Thioesterase n=1 Tax=Micromonospora parastrephiae TaxID=2806101 RepID=A0ABS1XQ47_9ACTN|nr:alpha/beta fold hydrolase [Micromonospora parastrephiae]MBM0231391.1 thioesterase [Micromonospora parastrephiae]
MPDPALRLVVFPHAGASGTAYHPLAREIPADWDLLLLDLPGRGQRHRQPARQDMGLLVAEVTEDIVPWTGPRMALFGHSLGAVVATEVARGLEDRGVGLTWLGVSGRIAPHGERVRPIRPELPDDELMRALIELGGVPDRIEELPEFRERFLNVVRADLRMLDSYVPDPGRAPLRVPLTVFGGMDDPLTPPAGLAGWSHETEGSVRQHLCPGEHFFFFGDCFPPFARLLVAEIESAYGE